MLSQTTINYPEHCNFHQPVVPDDTTVLARRLAGAHREDVARLACLVQLWRSLVQQRESACGVSLDPIARLQADLEVAWMRERGITSAELAAAMHGLDRARETLDYLDSLPD